MARNPIYSGAPTMFREIGTPYRVLHTADWHLGKLLGDADRQEEHELFLHWLRGTIVAEKVDLLLVAGDIFDSTNPPQTAEHRYYEFLADLCQERLCEVLIVAGNHDSPSALEAPRRLLQALGIHVVGRLPTERSRAVFRLPTGGPTQLVVAAVPFLRDRDLRLGKLGQSREEIQAAIQIGLRDRYAELLQASREERSISASLVTGHLTLRGAIVSGTEREIHVGGLGIVTEEVFGKEWDYVALGHLHFPQPVSNLEHLRYAGSPIPLSFAEATAGKEVRLLEFSAGKLVANHALEVPRFRTLATVQIDNETMVRNWRGFHPSKSPLTPWIHVMIERGVNVSDHTIRSAAEGQPYRVLRVSIYDAGGAENRESVALAEAAITENLLSDPPAVFEKRLSSTGLPDPRKDALRTAFAELYDQYLEGTGAPRRTGSEIQ